MTDDSWFWPSIYDVILKSKFTFWTGRNLVQSLYFINRHSRVREVESFLTTVGNKSRSSAVVKDPDSGIQPLCHLPAWWLDSLRVPASYSVPSSKRVDIRQWPPGFQAPGTGFLEDNLSMEQSSGKGVVSGYFKRIALIVLLWESNVTTDLTGGRDQAVMSTMGAAVNTDEASLTHPQLTFCCASQFLTGLYWSMPWGLGIPM